MNFKEKVKEYLFERTSYPDVVNRANEQQQRLNPDRVFQGFWNNPSLVDAESQSLIAVLYTYPKFKIEQIINNQDSLRDFMKDHLSKTYFERLDDPIDIGIIQDNLKRGFKNYDKIDWNGLESEMQELANRMANLEVRHRWDFNDRTQERLENFDADNFMKHVGTNEIVAGTAGLAALAGGGFALYKWLKNKFKKKKSKTKS